MSDQRFGSNCKYSETWELLNSWEREVIVSLIKPHQSLDSRRAALSRAGCPRLCLVYPARDKRVPCPLRSKGRDSSSPPPHRAKRASGTPALQQQRTITFRFSYAALKRRSSTSSSC